MKANHLLRKERERRGWSQARLAQEIGTTAKNISRWECGVSFPYPYFREQLCALFGQNAEALGLVQEESEKGQQQGENISPIDSSTSTSMLIPYDAIIPLHYAAGTGLIGRDTLLLTMKQRLKQEKNAAIVALSGLPGVGKTTLVASLAHDIEMQENFSSGILWASLGPKPNIAALLHRWSVLLGLSPATLATLTSIDSWAVALREVIGSRRMLLVLDDVWSVEDALSLTIGGKNCVHLVTTRFPALALSISSHEIIQVPELNEQASEQLLTTLASQLGHERNATRKLVSLAGGLPLALQLMGRYLRIHAQGSQQRRLNAAIEHLHKAEVRLHLQESSVLSERPPHLPAATPKSLLATISVSVQQLDEQACATLFALSVFPAKPNSFSEAAALAVTALPAEALDALSDAGLLESERPGRYTLHQTIADYARMEQREEYAYQRMVNYFVSFIRQQENTYSMLEQEVPNILAALHFASERGLYEEFLQGVLAFVPSLQLQGMYTIAEKLLQQASIISDLLPSAIEYCIVILLNQGKVAEKLGNYTQAIAYLQKGLTLARQSKAQEHVSSLLDMLGSIVVQQGNQVGAEVYFQEGLEIARLQGNQKRISDLLAKLGTLVAAQEDFTRADQYFQEGLMLARDIGYRERVSLLLNNLGWVAGELQEYTQAEVYFREALMLAQELGHRHGISRLLGNLAWIAGLRENYVQAEIYFSEALTLAHKLEQHWLLSNILQVRGEMYLRQHAFERAKYSFHEALKHVPAEAHELRLLLQLDLAKVSAASGDIVAARIQGEICLAELTAMKHSKMAEVQQWLQTF